MQLASLRTPSNQSTSSSLSLLDHVALSLEVILGRNSITSRSDHLTSAYLAYGLAGQRAYCSHGASIINYTVRQHQIRFTFYDIHFCAIFIPFFQIFFQPCEGCVVLAQICIFLEGDREFSPLRSKSSKILLT